MPCICSAISKQSISKEDYVTFFGVGDRRREDKPKGNDTVLKDTDPYTFNAERRFNETSVNAPRWIYYGSEVKKEMAKYTVMSDDCKMNTHFVPLINRTDVMKLNFEGRERQSAIKHASPFSFHGVIDYYIIPLLIRNYCPLLTYISVMLN
jgi:hypothetical protein